MGKGRIDRSGYGRSAWKEGFEDVIREISRRIPMASDIRVRNGRDCGDRS